MKVKFYKFSEVDDDKLKFAVIMAQYNKKWIFVKHKDRDTWEIPGGHREFGEEIKRTAERELYEETGAKHFTLKPVAVYSVIDNNEEESFGALYYAQIVNLGELPEFEIEKTQLFDEIPSKLTYPDIQPYLFNKIGNVYYIDPREKKGFKEVM